MPRELPTRAHPGSPERGGAAGTAQGSGTGGQIRQGRSREASTGWASLLRPHRHECLEGLRLEAQCMSYGQARLHVPCPAFLVLP